LEFSWHESIIRHRLPDPLPFEPPKRLFPLPLLLDFIYDVLVIGGNIAISLAFQRYYDRLDRERLLKANAQSELSYLKAQINPHFYMNMLNNIHGMIEIDAEGAQQMVIDMSHLMRYMLYDSSRATTTLDKEVEFISTYLSIMRRRYPRERVEISARLPEGDILRHIELPPLLFLVFIENAFKHGISYRRNSFVAISLSIEGDTLDFSIINSRPQEPPLHSASGIGLTNIRQRLDLIYGSRALLDITETPQSYTAHLTIPIHEAENHCD
ncbi:MAG: histidine kinase, partial [Paramuribaculum sp.]|nr:histidine kinase [Paramuribaculum sp.]